MSNAVIAIILLAEDTAPARELAQEVLEEEGYQVIAVKNANEALRLLTSDQRVDLLFTDIIMPDGIDDVELAVRARKLRDNLKVLFTSGTRVPDTSIEDTAFLSKPYGIEQMVIAVRQSLNAESAC